MRRSILLSTICNKIGVQYIGKDVEIQGLNLCNRESRHKHIISYVTSAEFITDVKNNLAIVCLLVSTEHYAVYSEESLSERLSYIICDNPEKLFYDIHDFLYYNTDFYDKYDFCSIIGDGCVIAESAVIDSGVVIGNRVRIGANTVVRRGTIIEDDCEIGCNNTIGSEGFQILKIDEKNRKAVHVGGLRIKSHVFIGDNNTICNSLFEGETYIGENTKIDNLVHVGHNGCIGDNAVITAGTILCGSSVVESGAWIGVNSSVLNRVTVGNGAKIGIGSVVTRDIPENALAYGTPAKVKMICGGSKK